jgi:transcriptional regulator with XRE-family HTH domain
VIYWPSGEPVATISPYAIRAARLLHGLTQAQAASVAHTSQRSWESWEAGTRAMPAAAFEQFLFRMSTPSPIWPGQGEVQNTDLIVILDATTSMPLDVVAANNFLDYVDHGDGTATISSLAVERLTNRPYIHSTKLSCDSNAHVVTKALDWKLRKGDEEDRK